MQRVAGHLAAKGITPAWAGKRWRRWYAKNHPLDHPRMGGEKGLDGVPTGSGLGSPPRGRGKAAASSLPSRYPRITPAWAGKRHHRAPKSVKRKDHPRVGGEKFSRYRARESNQGSPPRRRGKAATPVSVCHPVRITPAWAGKSMSSLTLRKGLWDHPRMGGEKPSQKGCGSCPAGSPPRGRGKAFSVLRRQFRFRITPAWAGKRSGPCCKCSG